MSDVLMCYHVIMSSPINWGQLNRDNIQYKYHSLDLSIDPLTSNMQFMKFTANTQQVYEYPFNFTVTKTQSDLGAKPRAPLFNTCCIAFGVYRGSHDGGRELAIAVCSNNGW